jgi:Na+-transporting NADH:ubiquinone oxidoreductase subunit NqrB
MKLYRSSSISRNMLMLVIVAIMPALIILLYSGLEQRRRSIEYAKNDISEKKKADTMLAEEKERLDVTMRSIGDCDHH